MLARRFSAFDSSKISSGTDSQLANEIRIWESLELHAHVVQFLGSFEDVPTDSGFPGSQRPEFNLCCV